MDIGYLAAVKLPAWARHSPPLHLTNQWQFNTNNVLAPSISLPPAYLYWCREYTLTGSVNEKDNNCLIYYQFLSSTTATKMLTRSMYDSDELLKIFLENVIRDALAYSKQAKRKNVTAMDVVYALKRQGRTR